MCNPTTSGCEQYIPTGTARLGQKIALGCTCKRAPQAARRYCAGVEQRPLLPTSAATFACGTRGLPIPHRVFHRVVGSFTPLLAETFHARSAALLSDLFKFGDREGLDPSRENDFAIHNHVISIIIGDR